MSMKLLEVSEEAHEIIKQSSVKAKMSMKTLTELLITTNVNFLNDPVAIAKKMQMVKDQK